MPEKDTLNLLREALNQLQAGFATLPDYEPANDPDKMRSVLLTVARRMQDNYPYHHPLYIGQMLKPPHPVARLAYMLALWINPNNHALDGGRASSLMEKEALATIAAMFGWDQHLGHLCGGGTMANLEALWIAGQLHPGSKILASTQAHYTHQRICEVLQLPFAAVDVDAHARMDMQALQAVLDTGEVGTVVATMGTTATGSVDPLPQILELQQAYGFRIHADAAYGGYFTLSNNLDPRTRRAFDHLPHVDSIVIDPHKHGLQPYGCGSVIFKDPSVGQFYKHDSPYTYFSSDELHLGEISLECSRPGAAAVALWATHEHFPLEQGGEFAQGLSKARGAALDLYERLQADDRFMLAFAPELDIVIFAPCAASASAVSALSQAIFGQAARDDLHMALTRQPQSLLQHHWPGLAWDQNNVTCLRTCLMKAEHLDWMDRIWAILDSATEACLAQNLSPQK